MPCNTPSHATNKLFIQTDHHTFLLLSALMNLNFHPVDGIGIFVSFHCVGIIQLPRVRDGPLLYRVKNFNFNFSIYLYLLYCLFSSTCCSGPERRKLIVSLWNLFCPSFLKLIWGVWMEQIWVLESPLFLL